MDFKFYIKQASYYKKVLKDWRDYLESFQENTLSDGKSKFKVQTLNDRKELIHCSDLEELEIFNEIKEIHTLIKKEREVYNSILKLIQEPSQVGLFASKTKTKKIRNEQFSKYFKKLLNINKEQVIRLNLFITSLKLLDAKNENIYSKTAEINMFAKKNNNALTDIDNTTIEKIETKKNSIKEIKDPIEIIKNIHLIKIDNIKVEEQKNKNIKNNFNYEIEIKRILKL